MKPSARTKTTPDAVFCPGYYREPFISLCSQVPDQSVYPPKDFYVEWGPVFHRGRLDGTARVLILGMVPTQLEIIARRILVGEGGQRVQGFLAKLGLTRSYVMVNTFIYSIANSKAPAIYQDHPAMTAYRHAWLDALVTPEIDAVIGLGARADASFSAWLLTPAGRGFAGTYVNIIHPTQPESAAHGNPARLASSTAALLDNWNAGLELLHKQIRSPDRIVKLVPYQNGFVADDVLPIPLFDLPAGTPAWMGEARVWATRPSGDRLAKRASITISPPGYIYRQWRESGLGE
jgi:hypothetical protein